MPRERRHAVGSIGSWLAKVEGEDLPVGHSFRYRNCRYVDETMKPGHPKAESFVTALRESGKLVLAKSEEGEDGVLHRRNYIAVYEVDVDQIQFDGEGLRFLVTDRLFEL